MIAMRGTDRRWAAHVDSVSDAGSDVVPQILLKPGFAGEAPRNPYACCIYTYITSYRRVKS